MIKSPRLTRTILPLGLLVVLPLQAELPGSLEKIPLYPGMTLQKEEKPPLGEGLLKGALRTYTVKAPIEDVVAFYEKALGITQREGELGDPNALKVGQFVQPALQIKFWNEDHLVDGNFGKDGVSSSGWIKKALSQRKKDRENAWIQDGSVMWYYRDTSGTMTEMQILFQDLSIDEDLKRYQLKSEVIIRAMRYEYHP